MTASVHIIGIVRDGTRELRFALEPDGTWRPEMVIDYFHETMTPFPDDYQPSEKILATLQDSWQTFWKEVRR